MAILDAEKIFVDSIDDITSVIDKVLSTDKESLILVIPQNSGIFTSIISLKILYRRSIEGRKNIIIVTEDEYGAKISQQAGFICVSKVSQITSDLWEVVNDKNMKVRAYLEGKGKSVIGQTVTRSERPSVKEEPETEDLIDIDVQVNETDELDSEVETIGSMVNKIADKSEEDIEEHEIEIDLSSEDVENIDTESELEQETETIEDKEISEKPSRQKSHSVTLKGITIMSGGDIAQQNNIKRDAKMDKLDNSETNMESKFNGTFTGRDFTKVRVEKSFLDNITGLFRKSKKPEDRFENPELAAKMSKRKRNQIIAIVSIVIGFILFISYMLVNNWSSVQINVNLKKEEVLATETVRLNFDDSYTFNEEVPDVIPALEVQSDEQTTSGTSTASGEAKSGTKATGKIYIINNSTDQIKIPAGTIITDTITTLDYVIKQETTLQAGTLGDDNTVNASTTSNIGIEAATFGEEFNVTNPQFVITGFESLVADIDVGGDLEGGFSEQITVVSQENVNALRDELLDKVKDMAESDLRASIPSGFVLIEESLEFEEPEVSSSPEIGKEPTSSGTFDVTVLVIARGIIVQESDLEQALSISLASSNVEGASGLEVNGLEDIAISDFTTTGNEVFVTLGAKGDVTNQLSEEEVEDLVKGESIENAQKILEEVETITSAEITYSPELVPGGFRKVPNNPEKITVKFE